MSKKTELRILGLSSAEIRGEAYVLILADMAGGSRRLPVVLGRPEAQAIAMALEDVQTERPTTHDLFVSFAHAFGVQLVEMEITRFDDGVYYSELTFEDENGERSVTMDSRTSDAIALALRTGTPIYASEQVMESAGFVLPQSVSDEGVDESAMEDENTNEGAPENEIRGGRSTAAKPENYTIEELERTLERLMKNEDYEEAAKIDSILRRKRGERERD
ncbi:MAG: bifunctional nuclease family protein [Muribaculaceae bacterium]|nr:bifunctional nuclease family protein [Muribaculaceae bacterium]